MKLDDIYLQWLNMIKKEQACALATVLQNTEKHDYTPERLLICQNGQSYSTLSHFELTSELTPLLINKLQMKHPSSETVELTLNDGRNMSIFIDIYTPPIHIIIFGGGHDAIPVANLANKLGYQTTVVDAREAFNHPQYFPHAKRVILRPEAFSQSLHINAYTYTIIMNHHIEKDRETLGFLLTTDTPYIGMLGPKSRREKIIQQLEANGHHIESRQINKLHNPIGLDIGAETSEEIAVSIFAEIIAKQKGHQGGFLHDKAKIHQYTQVEELQT